MQSERFVVARTTIAAFYAVLFFFAANSLFSWPEYLAKTELAPRWPVFWLRFVDTATGIAFVLGFYLLGSLLGFIFCGRRSMRIVVFVCTLEMLALRFSFGSINHSDHLASLLAFVLIFLPAGWRSRATRDVRVATLIVFSGAQAMIMLTYSMSGLWKVGGVIEQALRGEVTYLHPEGLAQQVAATLLSADRTSLLGPWLTAHPWVGWMPMVGALYLEFFALWIVLRRSLHVAWGLGLILLHIATYLTMGVGFPQNSLWLALFFVLSPFRPRDFSWRRAVADLPLLGRFSRQLVEGRRGRGSG